jgi:hypothetical protein
MELKINDIQLPDVIQFNYEELKQELTERVQKYETMVYTEDQIKEAKADKANLNKLKKALNDERIRREKEYMEPFNEFKTKINEIIAIIDKPVKLIDKQVKEYDEKKKADKRLEIGAYWENTEHPEWITLARIFDERWLNTGYSMRQIKDDIAGWINRTNSEMETLKQLDSFSFEAIEIYKKTLDINQAIAEGKRLADIQKRKEEAKKAEQEKAWEDMKKADEALANTPMSQYMTPPTEAPKEEPEAPAAPVEKPQWVAFKANLTMSQALELKKFFNDRNIEFKKVEEKEN